MDITYIYLLTLKNSFLNLELNDAENYPTYSKSLVVIFGQKVVHRLKSMKF
jgi:hypothetical protein